MPFKNIELSIVGKNARHIKANNQRDVISNGFFLSNILIATATKSKAIKSRIDGITRWIYMGFILYGFMRSSEPSGIDCRHQGNFNSFSSVLNLVNFRYNSKKCQKPSGKPASTRG